MNSLSWLIYLADVVGAFSHISAAVIAFSAVALFVILLISIIRSDERDFNSGEFLKNYIKYPIYCLTIFSILTIIIPSQKTVLMIAASEMGEKVITSQKAADIIDPSIEYINKWLMNNIRTLEKTSDK